MKERERKLKTKTKYFAVDDDLGIDVLCREKLKNGNETVYPFSREGKQRYKYIEKIEFINVNRESLKGFRTFRSGFGFTRFLTPLVTYIETNFPAVATLRVVSDDAVSKLDISRGVLELQKSEMIRLFRKLKPLRDRQSKELSVTVQNFLANQLSEIENTVVGYTPGSLASFLDEIDTHEASLSKSDIEKLSEFSLARITEMRKIEHSLVLKTKRQIESVYIEDVLAEFEKKIKQTADTTSLEKTWQKFFQDHPWIFTLLSPQAIVLFGKEAYFGGQDVFGSGDTITDFIYQNKLTKNVCIIEIKTHLTELVSKSEYRKGAGVHSISNKVSGAVNQGLDQKDKITKEFFAKYYNTKQKRNKIFEVLNPKVLVISGNVKGLKGNKKKSFELYRGSSKDVDIIGYDEVLERIRSVHQLMKK